MADSRISSPELLAFLKQVPFLMNLHEDTIAEIATVCRIKRIPRGHVIFSRGTPAEAMYIVRTGRVAEFAGGPNELEIVVKERRETDFFGEMGMLIDEPHQVTTVAMHSTQLIVIPREEFLKRVRTEPLMTLHLLQTFAKRLKHSGERLIAHTHLDAKAYLAFSILRLDREENGQRPIAVSQEHLAQSCGLARQTVAKILGEWRKAGWIKTRRGGLEVIDKQSLSEVIVSCIE